MLKQENYRRIKDNNKKNSQKKLPTNFKRENKLFIDVSKHLSRSISEFTDNSEMSDEEVVSEYKFSNDIQKHNKNDSKQQLIFSQQMINSLALFEKEGIPPLTTLENKFKSEINKKIFAFKSSHKRNVMKIRDKKAEILEMKQLPQRIIGKTSARNLAEKTVVAVNMHSCRRKPLIRNTHLSVNATRNIFIPENLSFLSPKVLSSTRHDIFFEKSRKKKKDKIQKRDQSNTKRKLLKRNLS